MRLGCLFSHEANVHYLHKAQSPYSVNMLAVMAAQAAVEDAITSQLRRGSAGGARAAVSRPGEAGHRIRAELGEFRAGPFRRPRDRSARRAARQGHSGARPQLRSAGLRPHHRGHARADAAGARGAGGDLETRNKPLLVFDMDGVLVDVTESYRETIARTVEHFTGARPTHERIQEVKNAGGWNDDWKLSHHMVREAGVEAAFEDVVSHFQSVFLGNGRVRAGLMLRERWVAQPGVLEKLHEHFDFAVFTGRPKLEAELTLRPLCARFGVRTP